MSKLILIPNSKKMIYDLIDKVDGYIIGVDDLSVNLPCSFSLSDTIEIINYLNSKNKIIFISLNKNMHNGDLDLLKNTLLELDKFKLTGIMYYDISIINLKNKFHLKNDLVWAQEHLTTNSNTTDFWYKQGVKYTYLSSEITRREIEEIKKATNSRLLVNLFGYLPIFTSKRHLIDNYLTTFNKEKNDNLNYMYKEDKVYPIIDNKEGTVTYSNYILNGIKEYVELDIDYAVINSFLIENIENIIDLFNNVNEDNKEESYNKINDMIKNTSTGFLYNETFYKVK